MPFKSGTHGDLLVLFIHSLLTTKNTNFSALYECLLTVVVNISPYLKSLSLLVSNKLMHLVQVRGWEPGPLFFPFCSLPLGLFSLPNLMPPASLPYPNASCLHRAVSCWPIHKITAWCSSCSKRSTTLCSTSLRATILWCTPSSGGAKYSTPFATLS